MVKVHTHTDKYIDLIFFLFYYVLTIKYLARDDSGLNLSVIPLLGHHLFFYLELPLDAF